MLDVEKFFNTKTYDEDDFENFDLDRSCDIRIKEIIKDCKEENEGFSTPKTVIVSGASKAGKTSSIKYLGASLGREIVFVNTALLFTSNTDETITNIREVFEYINSYQDDPSSVFFFDDIDYLAYTYPNEHHVLITTVFNRCIKTYTKSHLLIVAYTDNIALNPNTLFRGVFDVHIKQDLINPYRTAGALKQSGLAEEYGISELVLSNLANTLNNNLILIGKLGKGFSPYELRLALSKAKRMTYEGSQITEQNIITELIHIKEDT